MMYELVRHRSNILKSLLETRLRSNGHLSGPMGLVDVLTFLYFREMTIFPDLPSHPDRDRFVMSGYQYPALYPTLIERGFGSWNAAGAPKPRDSTPLPNGSTPGFEISSNSSLGQGLSIANGMALSLRMRGKDAPRVFVIIGDGECNEGQIWEALCMTVEYQLTQVVIIVNVNDMQLDGPTGLVVQRGLSKVFSALGFEVVHADGHDFNSMDSAFSFRGDGQPRAIFIRTKKGRGVSFIEADPMRFHACQLSPEEYSAAIEEVQ